MVTYIINSETFKIVVILSGVVSIRLTPELKRSSSKGGLCSGPKIRGCWFNSNLLHSFLLNRAIALSGRQIEIDLLRKQAEIWQNASVAQRLVCLASTQKMRFRLPLPAQMSHPAVGVQGQLIYPDCSKESL